MFNFFKKNSKGQTAASTTATTSNSSVQPQTNANPNTAGKVSLEKSKQAFERHVVSLSESGKVDLTKHKAQVAVCFDRSGSMDRLFYKGDVQDALTRLLPFIRFDDDGILPVYVFDHDADHVPEAMTEDNYQHFVKTEIIDKGYGPRGGTNYAPVIRQIIADYRESTTPVFVIFITDGENWDQTETDWMIRESSKYNIFFQFVGIGGSSFSYLKKLDKLDGRECDNTAFVQVSSFASLTDEQLDDYYEISVW